MFHVDILLLTINGIIEEAKTAQYYKLLLTEIFLTVLTNLCPVYQIIKQAVQNSAESVIGHGWFS